MIFCNHLLGQILQYLTIKEISHILLYLPALKDEIGKSYCLSNNIFNNLRSNITNYSDTLLYFQNNYIYRCYHCMKVLNSVYYLVICPCVINTLGVDIVYTKYHLDCINELPNGKPRTSEDGKIKIIKCQFCGIGRMCFICNLYS